MHNQADAPRQGTDGKVPWEAWESQQRLLVMKALGGSLKYSMGRQEEEEGQMQGTSEMSQIRRPENAQ